MAAIIISKASGVMDSIYGKVQDPVASFLESKAEAFQNAQIAKKIFSQRKSTHFAESYTSLTAANNFLPSVENGEYPQNGFEEGYRKTIENFTWKSQFSFSQEMIEDATMMDLKRQPEQMMVSYERTSESFFAQLLATAMEGKASFTLENLTFDCTTADGEKLFSQNHKPKSSGAKQCNAFTDAFSAEALGKAATVMQNMRGDNNEILGLIPDRIIIANDAELKAEIFGVLGAQHDPTTPGGNKYNYQFGNWEVIVWPYLNQFLTAGQKPWLLQDSRYNEMADGAIWQDRVPLSVKSEIDKNDANVWKGRARWGGGFVDFRAFVGCGLQSGGTL